MLLPNSKLFILCTAGIFRHLRLSLSGSAPHWQGVLGLKCNKFWWRRDGPPTQLEPEIHTNPNKCTTDARGLEGGERPEEINGNTWCSWWYLRSPIETLHAHGRCVCCWLATANVFTDGCLGQINKNCKNTPAVKFAQIMQAEKCGSHLFSFHHFISLSCT